MTQDTNKKEELPLEIALQVTLLEDDELIFYTDAEKKQHVYTKTPYDVDVEYKILPLYYSDLNE